MTIHRAPGRIVHAEYETRLDRRPEIRDRGEGTHEIDRSHHRGTDRARRVRRDRRGEAHALRQRDHRVGTGRVPEPHRDRVARPRERLAHGDPAEELAVGILGAIHLRVVPEFERLVLEHRVGRRRVDERARIDDRLECRAGLPDAIGRPVELRLLVVPPAHQRTHIAGRRVDRDHGTLQVVSAPARLLREGLMPVTRARLHSRRALDERDLGLPLQRWVECGVDGEAPFAHRHAGALDARAHGVDEVGCRDRHAQIARRPQRFGLRQPRLLGVDESLLQHECDDRVAPVLVAVGELDRIVDRGTLGQCGQRRRLGHT